MYELLKSPLAIGKMTMPNRVVMPAMGVFIAAAGGGVNDEIIAYYERRARGGVGLIITEVTRVVDGAGAGEPCQLSACRLSDVLGLQRLADAVHKYDTRLFIQLQHPGREASSALAGTQPVAPSAVANLNGGEVPRALQLDGIKELVGQFVRAAVYVKMAGADGVELHGAHGYLISEFLSPAMNLRTDAYGGTFENRMRFVVEILQGIRAACGPDFPVSVRINAEEDERLEGGIDLAEAARIARALEEAGADAINVSCFNAGCIEPGTYAQGWKKYMAEKIKQAVAIPVIAVCNIKEPAEAEKLLSCGAVDFVGVGRAHLADPDWCKKAFSGREDEIRKCIGCLACFGELTKLHCAKCSVNPVMGREKEYAHPEKNGEGRTVAIIGGGPAGLEAALVLKQRGFAPVVFEKSGRLGGTLNIADQGYGKDKITRYVDSLIRQVEKAGVEVRLKETATVENVQKLHPAGVMVACGAQPIIPRIEGIGQHHVFIAEDILLRRVALTGHVAVIGAGMTGLETAEVLAINGCKVTIVEMLDAVGQGIYPTVVSDVMGRILAHDATVLTGHRLHKILSDRVELARLHDGQTITVHCEAVVLALGVKPKQSDIQAFQQAFDNVHILGDARKAARIMEATQDAYGRAFVFDP